MTLSYKYKSTAILVYGERVFLPARPILGKLYDILCPIKLNDENLEYIRNFYRKDFDFFDYSDNLDQIVRRIR